MRRARCSMPLLVLSLALGGRASAQPSVGDTTPQWQALGAATIQAVAPPRPPVLVGRRGSPTAVWGNLAGWDDPRLKPSNRSSSIAVSQDGQSIAVAWLHNADPAGPPTGEPTAFASVGAVGGRFAGPTIIGVRPFNLGFGTLAQALKYNGAHNAPFVYPVRGGFTAVSVPMNANGYAEARPATGYAFAIAAWQQGWTRPSLAPLQDPAAGSSLSEMSGGQAPDGSDHLFGQGHLGRFQGAFAHQVRLAGGTAWQSRALALAVRPAGMNYFAEGVGAIAPNGDLHVAFAWNRQGATPMYGLYYMWSRDGGTTWLNARGRPVAVPLVAGVNDAAAAVIPANLSMSAYAGATPGAHGLSLAVAADGRPMIVRLQQVPGSPNRVQARVHAFTGGNWVSVPVGYQAYWNQGGTGIAINTRTGRVNVLLLEPGNLQRPAQVIRYDAGVWPLRQGRPAWRSQVVGEARNTLNYASGLTVAVAPNKAFLFLFEPSYRNPGRVSPLLGQAPLK